jgi:hypothetical protein
VRCPRYTGGGGASFVDSRQMWSWWASEHGEGIGSIDLSCLWSAGRGDTSSGADLD